MFPTEPIFFILLITVAVLVARATNLYAAGMLTGIFSLLSAGLFTMMDAVDVAFTEAAVGAGISTVLILGTLSLTSHEERQQAPRILPFGMVVIVGLLLVWGTIGMKSYGDATAPIHTHMGSQFIDKEFKALKYYEAEHHGTLKPEDEHKGSKSEGIGLPNLVTSILASYRGYDTMGETGVIFTAGIGVMLLLSGRRRKLQLGETRANHSQSDVNVEPADEIEAVTAHTPDSEGESV
jgi:multicomponent Na+:H+ antiporter subunit B